MPSGAGLGDHHEDGDDDQDSGEGTEDSFDAGLVHVVLRRRELTGSGRCDLLLEHRLETLVDGDEVGTVDGSEDQHDQKGGADPEAAE